MKNIVKISIGIVVSIAATFVLVANTFTESNNNKQLVSSQKNSLTEAKVKKAYPTKYKTVEINGVDIFYREAGRKDAPTIVLLHGYPTSSHMYRNLIRDLSHDYHLIAPDYPGFGRSEQPAMSQYDYTFDNLANTVEQLLNELKVDQYSLYLMDYGAPVGYRIFARHPERVQSFIIQNGNAYEEGLEEFWNPLRKNWANNTKETRKPLEGFHSIGGLKWQYLYGVQDSSKVSPDTWHVDLQHLERPGNNDIQLALFYDYRTNLKLYPSWQKLFRRHQPPTLIVWGENDFIFPASGAHPYKRDLKNVELHLLNTGHFALEEKGGEIADYISNFMSKNRIK